MTFVIAFMLSASIFTLITAFREFLTPPVTLRERFERMLQANGGSQTLTLDDEQQKKSLQQRLQIRLESSGVNMQLRELAAISAVASFVALIFAWGATNNFTIGFLAMITTLVAVPYMIVERRRQKRLQQIDDQLAESLSIMSSGLKSGLTIQQTFHLLAEETSEPIKSEFGKIVQDLALGESLTKALENFTERVPSEDVRMFVAAVLIARNTGGDLSSVLENISGTIRDRISLKRDIQAKTAMSRMSATILSLAPLTMFFLLSMINPEYVTRLTDDPRGQMILILSAVLNVIGAIAVRRVAYVEGLDPKRK